MKKLTDLRFKWLICCATIAIIAIAAVIINSPDKGRASNHDNEHVGKYVYVDMYNILHTDRKCSRLNYKGMRSKRIKKQDANLYDVTICPKCVSDEKYEELKDMCD